MLSHKTPNDVRRMVGFLQETPTMLSVEPCWHSERSREALTGLHVWTESKQEWRICKKPSDVSPPRLSLFVWKIRLSTTFLKRIFWGFTLETWHLLTRVIWKPWFNLQKNALCFSHRDRISIKNFAHSSWRRLQSINRGVGQSLACSVYSCVQTSGESEEISVY